MNIRHLTHDLKVVGERARKTVSSDGVKYELKTREKKKKNLDQPNERWRKNKINQG